MSSIVMMPSLMIATRLHNLYLIENVGRKNSRTAFILIADQAKELLLHKWIESTGRFIQNDQFRLVQ